MVAHNLSKAEQDNVCERVVERAPDFGEHEKRTDRVIPVCELPPSI